MRLYDIAHARAGDKGDASILMVAPYDQEDFDRILKGMIPSVVASHFGTLPELVTIRPAPALFAITVLVRGRLSGGVTRSPTVDPHGKTLSGHLLDLDIP